MDAFVISSLPSPMLEAFAKWQGPFAPRTLLRFIASTDPSATLSSSAYGCGLDPRGYSFSRPQCVHCCYGPVTRNPPSGGLVDRLRRFCFHLLRYPNYGALTSSPAGLSPAEHASLHWTHNRTCRFPASGSRTRLHAFTHDGPRPSCVRRTRRKCP